MEPLTSAAAASAGSATAEVVAAKAAAGGEASLGVDVGFESAAEAREAVIGEHGLVRQLETIRFDSLEALAVRNEAALSEVSQIEANRVSGAAREEAVAEELSREYPAEDGYHIESQCPLRDEAGKVAVDHRTGESRRVDFVVIRDGQVVKSIEVTSETADKTGQMAKEDRIREAGGNYVVDRRTGELVPFSPGVKTEIVRRP